jgi:hypothetical protein
MDNAVDRFTSNPLRLDACEGDVRDVRGFELIGRWNKREVG